MKDHTSHNRLREKAAGPLSQTRNAPAYPYALAVGMVVIAVGVRLLLLQQLIGTKAVFSTFYPAVILAALFGGFRSGLAATVLSAVAVSYLRLDPVREPSGWIPLALFCLSCFFITSIVAGMQRAKTRAHAAELQLEIAAEKERATQAVTRGAEQYNLLFESISDGIVLHPFSSKGDHGRFTRVNKAFCDLLGYSTEQMLRLTPMEIVDPSELSGVPVEAEQLNRDRRLLFKKTLIAKDGGRIHAEMNTTIFELDGQAMALTILRDITAREQAEKSLMETQKVLNIFIEHAPAALAMFDREMRYLHASRRWRSDFGLGDRDILGVSDFDTTPDIPGKWREAERRALAGEVVSAEKDPFERPDSPVQWKQWIMHPWYTAEGSVGGIIIFSEDITARVEAEERLRELTQRLTYHMDHSPLAVMEWGPDMRLVRWAGAAEAMFGWKQEEVLGKRVEDLRWIHEDDEAPVCQIISDLRSGKTPLFSLNRNYTKDGSVIWCEWYNSSLIDDSGKTTSILSLVLDVTARKKLEEELCKYRETLESKVEERTAELRGKDLLLLKQNRMAAMGEMVHNIAHQWRQPLNVLGLHIQQLSLFYDTDHSREMLDNSIREAMKLIKHMSQTIDDFRTFFKVENEKSAFCLNSATERAINLVKETFKHNRILTVIHTPGEVWVTGYPNEFSHALLNLLQNAREAILEKRPDGGVVTVVSSVENGRAIITIADNAGGIPEDIADHIFEPYFSTKGLHGTGIGLYMTRTIIENNMGGRIAVRNTAEGAEFRIELELCRSAVAPASSFCDRITPSMIEPV